MTQKPDLSPVASSQLVTDSATSLSAQNPWPGLAPYTEEQKSYFFGRSADSADLLQLVKRDSLTILFGRSGLGKSSLLQAGLFPLLRKDDGLPVYFNFRRLDHSAGAPSLSQQVLQSLVDTARSSGIEPPALEPNLTLWEYFHRTGARFWTAGSRVATPVLVFDQFEELFSIRRSGAEAQHRIDAFVRALADLTLDNRVPDSVRQRVDAKMVEPNAYDYSSVPRKVVIALREDYLPDLEALKRAFGSSLYNRKRLLPMNGKQAMEILLEPGGHLLTRDVAVRIVEFVAAGSLQSETSAPSPESSGELVADPNANVDPVQQLEVEPALLSVVCHELNNSRQAQKLEQITPDLLEGNSRQILRDFYRRSVSDVPPAVKEFIEDELVTLSGGRNRVALENVPDETKKVLEKLVDRRLVCVDVTDRRQWLELTHDRLTDPIRLSRQERVARQEAEAKSAREKQEADAAQTRAKQARRDAAMARRRNTISAALILALILATAAVWWGMALKTAKKAEDRAMARYYDMRIREQVLEHFPQTPVAEKLMVEGKEWITHADLISLLLPPSPFVEESVYSLNVKDLAPVFSEMAYSPDGRYLAALRNGRLLIMDVSQKPSPAPRLADVQGVEWFAFRPDTSRLAVRRSNSQAEETLELWDLNDAGAAKAIATYRLPSARNASTQATTQSTGVGGSKNERVAVSPKAPAAGDISNATPLRPFLFAPDGRSFFVSEDSTILRYDLDSNDPANSSANELLKIAMSYGDTSQTSDIAMMSAKSLALMLNGRILVAAGSGFIYYWNVDSGKSIESSSYLGINETQVCASPDGWCLFATGDGKGSRAGALQTCLADTTNLTSYNTNTFNFSLEDFPSVASSSAFGPDGRMLAVGTAKHGVLIFGASGNSLALLSQSGKITAVAFRPDGKGLASASDDGNIAFWKLRPREETEVDYAGLMNARTVAVSPDGSLLARLNSNVPCQVWVFAAKTGRLQAVYACPAIRGRDKQHDIAVRDDGDVIAAVDDGHQSGVWDLREKKFLPVALPDSSWIKALRLSDDGTRLVLLGTTNDWQVLETSSGRRLGGQPTSAPSTQPNSTPDSPTPDEPDSSLAIDHAGSTLAIFSSVNDLIEKIDLASGKSVKINVPGVDPVTCMEFSGDNSCLLCGRSNSRLLLLDGSNEPTDDRKILELSTGNADAAPSFISVSRDDRILVQDSGVSIQEQAANETNPELANHTLSPESEPTAQFWAAWQKTQHRLALLGLDSTTPTTLPALANAYQPLKDYLNSQRADDLPPPALIAREVVQSAQPLPSVPTPDQVERCIAHAGGSGPAEQQALLSNVRDRLEDVLDRGKMSDPSKRGELAGLLATTLALQGLDDSRATLSDPGGTVNGVALSRDGSQALTGMGDNSVKLWDVKTAQLVNTLTRHTGPVYGVAFSPDGLTALSGSRDNNLILWDLAAGYPLKTFSGHTAAVLSVAFSPDGKLAISGSADQTLILWDVSTGQAVRTFHGHTGSVYAVAFSPDGKTVLSGSVDHTMRLWDVNTGEMVQTFSGNADRVCGVAFSPEGRTAVSAGADGTARIWDIASGKEISALNGHSGPVYAVAVNADGRTLLTGNGDHTLSLWDIASHQKLRTFSGHTDGVCFIAIGPNDLALSSSTDNTAKLWNLKAGDKRQRFFDRLQDAIDLKFDDWPLVSSAFDASVQLDPRFPADAGTLSADDVATAAFERADLMNSQDDYQETLRLLNLAIQRGARSWKVLYEKGFALVELKKYDEAVFWYQEALKVAPDEQLTQTRWKLARTLRKLGPSRSADALEYATKLVDSAEPKQLQSCLALQAGIYFDQQDDADAMKVLGALAADSKDPEDWSARGDILQETNRFDLSQTALDAYSNAIQFGANGISNSDRLNYFYGQRAICERELGYFPAALGDIGIVRQTDPNNEDAAIQHGIIRAAQGYPAEAITDFSPVIDSENVRQDPDPYLIIRRAECCFELEQYDQAKTDISAAIQAITPQDMSPIDNYLCLISNERIGLSNRAAACLQIAVSPDPFTLARIWLWQDRRDEAMTLFNQAAQLEPKNSREISERAVARAYLGQFDGAESDALGALARSPANPWRAHSCALVYLMRATNPAAQLPATQESDRRDADLARSLYYLGRWSVGENRSLVELQISRDLEPLHGDPAFQQLIHAQQQVDDKPDRAIERAKFFAQVYHRLRACSGTVNETPLCLDAALSEVERAHTLGLDPTLLADHNFDEIRDEPRFQAILTAAPATEPATTSSSDASTAPATMP